MASQNFTLLGYTPEMVWGTRFGQNYTEQLRITPFLGDFNYRSLWLVYSKILSGNYAKLR